MSCPLKTESSQRCSLQCSGSSACKGKGMLPAQAAPFPPLKPTEPNLHQDQMSQNYFILQTIYCSALAPFPELQDSVPIPANPFLHCASHKRQIWWEWLTVPLAEILQQGNEARRWRESFLIWPLWLTAALTQCPVWVAVFWSTELWTQLHQALPILGGKEPYQRPQSWAPHTTHLPCNVKIKDRAFGEIWESRFTKGKKDFSYLFLQLFIHTFGFPFCTNAISGRIYIRQEGKISQNALSSSLAITWLWTSAHSQSPETWYKMNGSTFLHSLASCDCSVSPSLWPQPPPARLPLRPLHSRWRFPQLGLALK